jgi:hypothetical protein
LVWLHRLISNPDASFQASWFTVSSRSLERPKLENRMLEIPVSAQRGGLLLLQFLFP